MKKFLLNVMTTAVFTAVTTNAIAAEQDAFAMTVLLDQAQGSRIVNGSFTRAIDRLTKNEKSMSRPGTLNNLCVAYAKTQQIDEALSTCDAAIEILQTKLKRSEGKRAHRDDYMRQLQSDLSILLSNRGVLFAIKGDHGRAREYFETAIDLPVNRSRARQNLDRLAITEF